MAPQVPAEKICAQQLRSKHRTNKQKRGRAGQSDGSRFEPVSVLATPPFSSRSLGSLIRQTKRILFSMVVRSPQTLNGKTTDNPRLHQQKSGHGGILCSGENEFATAARRTVTDSQEVHLEPEQ